MKKNKLPALITFIDFRKVFDTVHRGKMLKILKAFGIPNQIVRAIVTMYENTRAKVITQDVETEPLSWFLTGRHSGPISIVLHYARREVIDGREEKLGFQLVERQSRRIGPEVLTDLDFADDIALLSDEVLQAQNFALPCVNLFTPTLKVGL